MGSDMHLEHRASVVSHIFHGAMVIAFGNFLQDAAETFKPLNHRVNALASKESKCNSVLLTRPSRPSSANARMEPSASPQRLQIMQLRPPDSASICQRPYGAARLPATLAHLNHTELKIQSIPKIPSCSES